MSHTLIVLSSELSNDSNSSVYSHNTSIRTTKLSTHTCTRLSECKTFVMVLVNVDAHYKIRNHLAFIH